LTGTVTKVEWMNHHARFYLGVKDGDKVTNWEFELGSPNGLIRLGCGGFPSWGSRATARRSVKARDRGERSVLS